MELAVIAQCPLILEVEEDGEADVGVDAVAFACVSLEPEVAQDVGADVELGVFLSA